MGGTKINQSKKIVFINQATGYLTIDVINAFAREYQEVGLICGSIRVQDVELHEKVVVSQISLYDRGSNRRKAISWMIGTIQIYWLLLTKYRNYEVFYYTIPPTAYLLSLLFKSPYCIMIYDLFPDALKIRGHSEKGFLYSWWAGKNLKVFSKARKIITLSEQLKKDVMKYAPEARVEVIPNWSAFTGRVPVAKEANNIILREGLTGKFIVQYSGNIGVTHNVEAVVEVAESLKEYPDIDFLIIGRGERKNVIEELIVKKNLKNCKLLPFRKDEELYESLCVPDIAVVTLDDRVPDISVPSKTYNILTASVPILAIASKKSSVSELINQHKVGRTFEKNEVESMKEFILTLKNDKNLRAVYKENALLAAQDYTSNNAYEIYKRCM
ncbi:glycosyltransferase family 4 protein [Saccharicrinis sp. 156]|uniref:glycosyltransferase family 4 protein n=1 Tax=Saccharicrinis sp. 156 TaxID=3417574 RepID=UPI003D334CCD